MTDATTALAVSIAALLVGVAAASIALYFEYQSQPDIQDDINDNSLQIALLKKELEKVQNTEPVDLSEIKANIEALQFKHEQILIPVMDNASNIQIILDRFESVISDINDLQIQINRLDITTENIEDGTVSTETVNIQIQSLRHETEKINDTLASIDDDIDDIEDSLRDLDDSNDDDTEMLQSDLRTLKDNHNVLKSRVAEIEQHLNLDPPVPDTPGL